MMQRTINEIKERMADDNATEGHMRVEMKDGSLIVISVYESNRPCFLVLRELMQWAKSTRNQSLVLKIQDLKNPPTLM